METIYYAITKMFNCRKYNELGYRSNVWLFFEIIDQMSDPTQVHLYVIQINFIRINFIGIVN